MKVVKLTPQMMKRLVQEEAAKIMRSRRFLNEEAAESASPDFDAELPFEVEADEYADTLEQHIDHYKANKIKEARLIRQLKSLREMNARIRSRISRRIV